jgi:CRP/FNR family transcriptional regulator, cyclic AMP receptor protein
MQSIEQTLVATRMFGNLTPDQLRRVAALGQEAEFADRAALMVEGEPADSFFMIREGFVALETEAPSGAITIETLHNGDPVGWSWLFEPYLTHFDARSRGVTHAIRFDAAALRERCLQEPGLGYELMRSFASVIVERLQATRLQLLDVYGRATVS